MDDDGLIAAVAGGDDTALRELFSRHAPWLAARRPAWRARARRPYLNPSERATGGNATIGGHPRVLRLPLGFDVLTQQGNLLDIVVATKLGAGILRGARRAAWGGLPGAIAWGRLPADGTSIAVHFSQRRLRRWPGSRAQPTVRERYPGGICPAQVSVVGERFWVATADGRFDSVAVAHHGTHERRRIATVRSP